MAKRDIIILLIAVVCGIIAFVFSLQMIKGLSKKKANYICVIARDNLPKDAAIETKNLALSAPLNGINPDDVFFRAEDVAGYAPVNPIAKGSIVHRSDVVKLQKEAPKPEPTPRPQQVPLPIPEGMRGITLIGDQVEGFPFGLRVGSYADIFGTVIADTGRPEKKSIVRGVQVIAVEEAQDGTIQSTVIALPPRATDVVMKALGDGKIRLVPAPDRGGKISYTSYGTAEIIRGIQREKAAQVIQGYSKIEDKKPASTN